MAKAKTTNLTRSTVIFLSVLFCCAQGVVTPLGPQISFLPGIGEFLTPTINSEGIRIPRSNPSSNVDNLDNPFLAPTDTYTVDEPLIVNSSGPLETFKPPIDTEDGKCSYVQMKGGPLPRAECQPGGMACSKDCSLEKASRAIDATAGDAENDESNCVTVTERMCGDVPKEECETVNEKVCEQVPEETCNDDGDDKSNEEPESDTK